MTQLDSPAVGKRPRSDVFFGIASAVLGIVLGAIVASVWPGNSAHVPNPSQADQAATYLRVREANFGPLVQALNGIGGDCSIGETVRCSLSLAYTLALVQKFQAELRPIAAPSCLIASDVELKQGLQRLDDSLHQAIQAGAPPPDMPGVADVQASEALIAQANCT